MCAPRRCHWSRPWISRAGGFILACAAARQALASRVSTRADALFQRLRKGAGHVESGLLADLNKPGRTGHVDLGQVVADHVQPDDEQTLGRERTPYRLGDLAIARRKRTRYAAATSREVAARLPGLGNACQRVRGRLAIDQDDALVPVDDFGNESLRHDAARPEMR